MKRVLLLIIPVVLLLVSCTSAEKDYQKLQESSRTASNTLTNSHDFDSSIVICDEIIREFEDFAHAHSFGAWSNAANMQIAAWKTLRTGILSDRYTAMSVLYRKSEDIAVDAVRNHDRGATITNM